MMRKFTMYNLQFTIILLAAIIVMFAAPTTASAALILTNGDFSNGLSGWSCGGGVSGTCSAVSGTARVDNSGGSWGWQISQGGISAYGGQQFCLSGRVSKYRASDTAGIALQEGGGSWREIAISATNTTSWQTLRQTITIGSNWVTPIQVFARVWNAGGIAWFDDIALQSGACQGDTSGPATSCNGNVSYSSSPGGYGAWDGTCSSSLQRSSSGGIGQGCCESTCGADSQCDEQSAGLGNCSSSCSYFTPNCNTNLDCNLCSVPYNTCSTNNGTQTCYYRAYTGGGTCNVTSFNQSCSRSNCSSGYTCSNGNCIPPPPAPSLSTPSCPAPGTTASFNWSGNNSTTSYYELFIDNQANPWGYYVPPNGLYPLGNDSANRINSPTNSFSSTTIAGNTYRWWMRACNSAGCSSESYGPNFTCTRPNCNTNLDCDLCSVPYNTCSTNNGTQTCYYRAYTGGGSCNVVSFNQSCTRDRCDSPSGYSCISGTCIPTSPTPTISANPTCTPADPSSMYTISWTNNASYPVLNVDISTDNFASWYNKAVTGASTSASSGFGAWTGVTGALTIQPNTTYYVRTWNGYKVSGTTAFTTPGICPPSPPTNPAGSCPVPGSTANLSWTGVSGATRYDVFVQDLAYGSLNWPTAQCGQNGLVVCQRVYGSTSYSFLTTPGRNYQWYVLACNGEGPNCSAAASYSTTFSCLYNNAQYVSQSCPPSNMTPGQTASAWVIMNNNGNTTWPASSTYRLGSQNPQDNSTWGSGRIIPSSNIPPGSNYTFSRTVTAPSALGTYNFQWRMVQEAVEWFGGTTPNCSVTVALPPPPTANINAPANNSSTATGQSMSVSATAAGTNLTKVNIYRALKTSDLTQEASWTRIAENDSCGGQSICGINSSWTPTAGEIGQWVIAVNAFDNYNQRCSGMGSSGGYWTAACNRNGSTSNITVNITPSPPTNPAGSCPVPGSTANLSWTGVSGATRYDVFAFDTTVNPVIEWRPRTSDYPQGVNCGEGNRVLCQQVNGTSYSFLTTPGDTYQWYVFACNGSVCSAAASYSTTFTCIPPPPPRASVNGLDTMMVGDTLTFTASLTGSAQSGQIWITKGNGKSTFPCPQGPNGAPYLTNNDLYYWCPVVKKNNTTDLSGTYTFVEPGTYTTVVNAFSDPYQLGAGPSDECSGTPSSLGFDSNLWSDCGTSDNIVTINAAPRASVTGRPETGTKGLVSTFTATLTGGAKSGQIWITKGDGRSVFPCPTTIYFASTERFWCNIGNGTGSTITGIYTFVEPGTYTTVVNAYANTNQTGAEPSDECSGTPSELGINPSAWSDCGTSDNVVTVISSGPAATLTGSKRGIKGSPSTFTANLLGNAQSAQIWITKGDGRSNFYCNGAENNATRTSAIPPNPPYYWCNIGSGAGSTVTGSYTFPDTDRYTAVVNAFTNSTTTYTTNPSTECTGTPNYLGFDPDKWSDCGGEYDYLVITSSAPTATNCGGGTSPRAEGLVTSPLLESGSKFGTTTTGRCVVDSATEFSPYKIPSYEDLKFIYYTQSKASKTEVTPPSGTANQGTLRSALNNYDTVLIKGNLDIGANLGGASKTAVVFVNGNLNIDTPTFTFGDASSGLVFVVGGNVIINRSVTRIDAVIISGGTIYTADGCSTRNSVDAEQLIVNGSLISLDTGNIIFCRALSDNALPAEKINSDPKYLVILRDLYADIVQRWSEIP